MPDRADFKARTWDVRTRNTRALQSHITGNSGNGYKVYFSLSVSINILREVDTVESGPDGDTWAPRVG